MGELPSGLRPLSRGRAAEEERSPLLAIVAEDNYRYNTP
jgi:hypothetical protein